MSIPSATEDSNDVQDVSEPPDTSHNEQHHDENCVQVAVRVRPLLEHERGTTECVDVIQTSSKEQFNLIQLGGQSGPNFTFDQVFGSHTLQGEVYNDRVAPLVTNCLEGYNATVLAYGQTGSGKTHTIMGPSANMTTAMLHEEERHQAGVIPRAIRSIFHQLQEQKESSENNFTNDESNSRYDFEVRIQFLEVYGEEIRDLLNPQQATSGPAAPKLSIRDVGNEEPEVVGATEHKVESAEEALLCLTRGMYRRVTGSTAMNECSSRSHAILSLIIEQSSVLDNSSEADTGQFSNEDNDLNEMDETQVQHQQHVQLKRSKFNFVDLAGSERQKRTQASGQRLKEGIDINKGLLVLGNVISALGDPRKQGKTFVPYRDSKLTRLLKGSLGGNHKTLMVACVSPSSSNMEETLNCLRYANRAKNIQNHAVVNVDATSQLVTELKGKVQRLAEDLMRARTGKIAECSIPMTVIESLAKGGDGGEGDVAATTITHHAVSPSPRTIHSTSNPEVDFSFPQKSSFHLPLSLPLSHSDVQRLIAENEAYRLQIKTLMKDEKASEFLQKATNPINSEDPKMEVLSFNKKSQRTKRSSVIEGRAPSFRSSGSLSSQDRSESPELSRLKSQVFGSLSQSSTVDAEMEAEEKAVKDLSDKYINRTLIDDGFVDVEGNTEHADSGKAIPSSSREETSSLILEADLLALSSSISAKEELIYQLQASQEKYESMREFYEEKLKEMEQMLIEQEAETEKLSEELKKVDLGHSRGKELSEKLKMKQAQVMELKRKQAELSRLTTVASRNESQISRLRLEVKDMKQKKVDLQKQITSERKSHLQEVQKLKKENMQKDRELNKVLREKSKKSQEAMKAQQVAKTRLDQMNKLKEKYKDTEKRLRMQTVKRGVLKKAGLDPVMIGRRQPADYDPRDTPAKAETAADAINIDSLRDHFDQKVMDVSRRENIAEKLAQEWEEHLELTIQREEMLQNDSCSAEAENAVEAAIRYREDRIRQLASRLGKREKSVDVKNTQGGDEFLFDENFQQIVGQTFSDNAANKNNATRVAAKVLFGMVVRERRRIASLARTASHLDDKVREAEADALAKDAAFRAYVDEQRLEAAALAQNQQEHILSLMEMVKESPTDDNRQNSEESARSGTEKASRLEDGNSKLLVLANERIAVLERQLNEISLGRDAVKRHREREDSAMAMLEEKKKECEEMEEIIDELKTALRRIREELSRRSDDDDLEQVNIIRDILTDALHPSSASVGSTLKRRRSSMTSAVGRSPSLTPKIRHETQFMHSSDSDEVPDWADDIMADLAIIAEGKIPLSLMESQEVLEAENLLNGTVFDRLTNPVTYTGIQKQKSAHATKSSKKAGQQQRKMISIQVSESLNRVLIPGETGNKKGITRKSKENSITKSDEQQRSVFDRLLSPSNLTGTQRRRFQDKKGRDLEKAIENQHVSLRPKAKSMEYDTDDYEEQDADHLLDELLFSHSKGCGASEKSEGQSFFLNKLDEYKRQDVFERLNKTTTQAYAVKQNTNIAEKMLDDILDSSDSGDQDEEMEENFKNEPRFDRVEEYASRDVFERLQKTTTEAYAKKKNSSIAEEVSSRSHGSSPPGFPSPTKGTVEKNNSLSPSRATSVISSPKYLNVFERLQRKTTEAFAKKKNAPAE